MIYQFKVGTIKALFERNNIERFSNKVNNMEFQMTDFSKIDRKPKNTDKSDKLFVKVIICWLCDKEFRNVDDKVKYYCMLSGKYL